MSIRNIALAAGAVALLPLAALAMDEAGPGSPGPHAAFAGGPHGEHGELSFLKGANLTDAQRTQIHQMMRTNFTAHQAEMEQLHSLHKQIEDTLVAAGPVNKDQLMALQKKEAALHDQLDVERLETAMQMKALLTPAQQEQAATFHQKMESLHQQEHALMDESRSDGPPLDH